MIDNKILIGIILVIIGGATAGVLANAFQAEQQYDELDFNPSNGFSNDNNGKKYFLDVKTTYNVLNITVVNTLNQYIGIIYVELNQINFYENNEEYIDIGGHTFNIPKGNYMSSGYSGNENNLIFSEIYQTSDNTSFGIIIVSTPGYNSEQLVNDFAKGNNLNIAKFNLTKIDTSQDINIYKFEVDGLVYYVYDDGVDIIIIVMDDVNDNLFMYLTNSSSTGSIDPSNPYYQEQDQDQDPMNTDENSQNQEDYQEDTYYDDNNYDDPYYDYENEY